MTDDEIETEIRAILAESFTRWAEQLTAFGLTRGEAVSKIKEVLRRVIPDIHANLGLGIDGKIEGIEEEFKL